MRRFRLWLAKKIAGPHRDYGQMWDELHAKLQVKR